MDALGEAPLQRGGTRQILSAFFRRPNFLFVHLARVRLDSAKIKARIEIIIVEFIINLT